MTNKSITGRWAMATAACMLFFLISCSQEPIFYSIEREVEQKKASIFGIVYSVVYFQGDYYAANGTVYTKKGGTKEDWKKVSSPEGFVIRLAADANNLYAMNSNNNVYHRTATSTWTKIAVEHVRTVFGDGEQAYVTKGDKTTGGVFRLVDGAVADKIISDDATYQTIAATTLNGKAYFSNTQGFTSSDTLLYRLLIDTNKNARIQWSEDNVTWTRFEPSSIPAATPALVYWKENDSTSWLIAGTGSSIKMIRLNADGTVASVENPSGNTLSVLGDMRVFDGGLYIFPYNTDKVIFASVAYLTTSKRNGLRGFYDTVGEKVWNRE